jgi:hypothetical protein
VPSCGTVWNTFWTAGVCPGCNYHWQKTQCLACGEISPHEDWYHYPPDPGKAERAREMNEAAV